MTTPDKMAKRNEPLAIKCYYGDRKILNLDTKNLTPQEASDLMRTISALVIGITELRT